MREKNRVLIVDDEYLNREILQQTLEDEFEILIAKNGKEALWAIEKNDGKIAAVILDLIMPEFNGFDFLEEFQKSGKIQKIPVIVATGDEDVKNEERCLELGAWDFLKKPYDIRIIKYRLMNVIARSEMDAFKELKYREDYDFLTGIFTRNKFEKETLHLLKRHPEQLFAIIRFDIYKFKLINSFFGKEQGDLVLKYTADLIRSETKDVCGALAARIEADNFCICLPYENTEEILVIIRNIRNKLARYWPEYDIVPVFGIYLVSEKKKSVSEMIDNAHLASQKCKGNYVENYAFYTEDLSDNIVKEQLIVNSMTKALEEEQFLIYIQPKYNLYKDCMDGGEVLVRWMDPVRGVVSPGEFIPIFERNGFIMQLDYYIWDKTCRMLSKWLDEGKNPRPLSVNISRVSFYNPNLIAILTSLIESYHIPVDLLQLELTESAYSSNPDVIREMVAELQKKGFKILMDDFGSAYSSLNVLKDIVVDILKIDMKFMEGCDVPGRGESILASVVKMAKWLNIPVVAEGVEEEQQKAFLKSIGCEYIQGYYYSPPLPIEEYEQKILMLNPDIEDTPQKGKRKEDILWDTDAQMKILFNEMLQPVAIYEYENGMLNIVRVNNAYFDLFGITDSDLHSYSANLLSLFSEEERTRLLVAMERCVQEEDYIEMDAQKMMMSGNYIWLRLRLKHIGDVGNKHIMYGVLTDISYLKQLEAELEELKSK